LNIARAPLYWRTLRQLRPRQIVWRALRLLQRRLPVHLAGGAAALVVDAANILKMRDALLGWGDTDPEGRIRRAREIAGGNFRFVGQEVRLAHVDWRARHVSHLWTFHLHYFDYAVDLAWAYRHTGEKAFLERLELLVSDWIEQSPPGNSDSWHPYPTSLRVVNWIKAYILVGEKLNPRVGTALLASLRQQIEFLSRRLEWDLLANHLLKNLKALAVAGLFFTSPATGRPGSRAWGVNMRRLRIELSEQILSDGGHFERSPMYHAVVLEDVLELIGFFRSCSVDTSMLPFDRIRTMAPAYARLSRPDGTLHRFNDSADDGAPPRPRLLRQVKAILEEDLFTPDGAWSLPATGYFGFLDSQLGERMVVDCGPIGPRHQPAHAHCDLLSFELDIGGHPLIVDSGLAGYEGHPLRAYVRSTRAHNTVASVGQEQCEMWGTFRVAGRAEPLSATIDPDDPFTFVGSYRPYAPREARHTRTIKRTPGGWLILDRLTKWPENARSYLHIHPDWRVEVVNDGLSVLATFADCTITIETFGMQALSVLMGESDPPQGWFCPRFGSMIPAPVLECVLATADGESGYEIRSGTPTSQVM
jgi:hypothetical protein